MTRRTREIVWDVFLLLMGFVLLIGGAVYLFGCRFNDLVAYKYAKPDAPENMPSIIPAVQPEKSAGDTEKADWAPENIAPIIPAQASQPTPDPWYTDPATIAVIVVSAAAGIREVRKQWGNAKRAMGKA